MFRFILLFICFIGALHADELSKEIDLVGDMIASAENAIKNLQSLQSDLKKYQAIRKVCLENPDDNESLYKMIKLAQSILDQIKIAQLTTVFEPSFLSELTIVSKPASKLGIPKP